MSPSNGSFVWYELMTTDMAAAEAFYRAVVGWGAHDSGMPDFAYHILTAEETGVAGLMTVPAEAAAAGARPGWIGYVAVDDVDQFVTRVIAAGGRVHHAAQDIPNVGRFAVVADPQGAAFVLFKGALDAPPPRPAPGTPGTTGWHELHAVDGAAAFAFYADLFGWTKADAIPMGPMGVYQLFTVDGGMPVGGMMTKMPQAPMPYWQFYFNVPDIHAAAARVAEQGGQVIHGPQEVPGGAVILNCLDPQGALFALVAPPAGPAAA